jgi:hypothetical protein
MKIQRKEKTEKISDEELINTLLHVIESQNNIIRKMIGSKMEYEIERNGS